LRIVDLNNFLAGRVVGMEEMRNAYEILLREPESKYLLRRWYKNECYKSRMGDL